METAILGRTGVELPRVAVGTWGHSGPKTVKGAPVGWSGRDDANAADALVAAFDSGLTHWDTADVYGDGLAERLIASVRDRVPRDAIFLASKVGWDPGGYDHFYHPDLMRSRIERTLDNLATETVDLYYLHHCDFGPQDEYLDSAAESIHRFRDEGKIRFIGLSDWKSDKVRRYLDRVDPDVVQPYRNVIDDTWVESGLAAAVEERNLGVAFFSPLKHGLLLGRHQVPPTFGEGDHRRRVKAFSDSRELARLRDCARQVAERFPHHPEPVLHALVGALLEDAPSGCALLGMRQPHHSHSAAAAGSALSAEDAAWVRELYRPPNG